MLEVLKMITPEWITAIVSIVGVIGIWLLWKQIKADHERSRREKSVELILSWAQNLNQNISSARKFAEELDDKQSRNIFEQKNFTIDEKYEELLKSCFKGTKETLLAEKKEGKLFLSESDVSYVRWLLVTYLNSIEAILAAWRHNIADKAILEEQFRYLIAPEKGHYLLKKFRVAAGGKKSYPAIDEFVSYIENENNRPVKGKDKVI